jgi:hypothetical protein
MEGEELEMYPFPGVSQVGFHGFVSKPNLGLDDIKNSFIWSYCTGI